MKGSSSSEHTLCLTPSGQAPVHPAQRHSGQAQRHSGQAPMLSTSAVRVFFRYFKTASATAHPKTGVAFFLAKFREATTHSPVISVEKPSQETGKAQMET